MKLHFSVWLVKLIELKIGQVYFKKIMLRSFDKAHNASTKLRIDNNNFPPYSFDVSFSSSMASMMPVATSVTSFNSVTRTLKPAK
jgi:hypothetical protein